MRSMISLVSHESGPGSLSMQALLQEEKGLVRRELIMAWIKKLKWFPFIILAVLKFCLCKDSESDLFQKGPTEGDRVGEEENGGQRVEGTGWKASSYWSVVKSHLGDQSQMRPVPIHWYSGGHTRTWVSIFWKEPLNQYYKFHKISDLSQRINKIMALQKRRSSFEKATMSSERDKQDPVSFPPPPAGHPKPTEVAEALIYSSVKWE